MNKYSTFNELGSCFSHYKLSSLALRTGINKSNLKSRRSLNHTTLIPPSLGKSLRVITRPQLNRSLESTKDYRPIKQFDNLRQHSSSSSNLLKMTDSNTTGRLTELPITPYPTFDKNSRTVRTAACVIIGDEILNGKTLDSNSNHLASLLFGLGISLRKIEVIPDDETEIISTLRRLTKREDEFDMIFTSGGIGPTHDDITYQSIAKVFDETGSMKYDEDTLRRMKEINRHRNLMKPTTEEQEKARSRMALFPEKFTERLFVLPHLWVPVVRVKNKIFILPGVPGLFKQLLESLMLNYIKLPLDSEKPNRRLIKTTLPESIIAPFLSNLSKELSTENIKIGSYPNLVTGTVTISLIGIDSSKLEKISKVIEGHFESIKESSKI
ncbi:molybdopterin binding domain-containing protein [Phakopsora pachyrhizi]|uniref:Molybdopterin binding domain-containing protein n=1 Tax=Phakopsora pachyrhizi TaxID=170000 RepID=A0AAV0AFI4_PHAPC|nr:molybdopterin binding domain-containing protein [Phakopsora pachyrhizi]